MHYDTGFFVIQWHAFLYRNFASFSAQDRECSQMGSFLIVLFSHHSSVCDPHIPPALNVHCSLHTESFLTCQIFCWHTYHGISVVHHYLFSWHSPWGEVVTLFPFYIWEIGIEILRPKLLGIFFSSQPETLRACFFQGTWACYVQSGAPIDLRHRYEPSAVQQIRLLGFKLSTQEIRTVATCEKPGSRDLPSFTEAGIQSWFKGLAQLKGRGRDTVHSP